MREPFFLKPSGTPLRLLAIAWIVLVLALAGTASRAQQVTASFDQRTLDELLAPIALYPDALLTQVLIASTYPLDVVQAARFVDRSRDLAPDALAAAAEAQPWDPSVVALVRFPSVLAMMDDKLDWTQKLGEAFLAQQADVMDTVQALRARAQAAGNLQSNAQQTVVVQERVIVIEPAQPQVVYVPFFNPAVIYGTWWWPAPPRWVWAPPPWYRPPGWGAWWGPGWGPGVGWGPPVGAPPWIWHGRTPNWRNRNIVINNTVVNNNSTVVVNNPGLPVWTHNPGSRGSVAPPGPRSAYPLPVSTPANPRGSDRERAAKPPASRPPPQHSGVTGGPPAFAAPPAGNSGSLPGTRPLPQPPAPVNAATRPEVRPQPGVPAPGHAPAPRPQPGAPAAVPGAAPAAPVAAAPSARPSLPVERTAPRPTPQTEAGGTSGGTGTQASGGADRAAAARPGMSTPPRATP